MFKVEMLSTNMKNKKLSNVVKMAKWLAYGYWISAYVHHKVPMTVNRMFFFICGSIYKRACGTDQDIAFVYVF